MIRSNAINPVSIPHAAPITNKYGKYTNTVAVPITSDAITTWIELCTIACNADIIIRLFLFIFISKIPNDKLIIPDGILNAIEKKFPVNKDTKKHLDKSTILAGTVPKAI